MNLRPKILVVDDEEDYCHFVRFNLESTNRYRVYTATSGTTGIRMARTYIPHMIFLDIMMPDMDGFEVLATLKQNTETIHIPVIMLTALEQDVPKIKACEWYCEDYLIKPVKFEAMMEKIATVLKQQATRSI